MAAAGSDQQEFDAAAADPVTNRGHLLASPQPAELREAKKLNEGRKVWAPFAIKRGSPLFAAPALITAECMIPSTSG